MDRDVAVAAERARFRAWLVEASEKAQRDVVRAVAAYSNLSLDDAYVLGKAEGRLELLRDLLTRYDQEIGS